MSESETPLIPDQRREALMRLLHQQPVLSVLQLTDLLGVSHMTVRRDIADLEREGRAVSVPGGVRLASGLRSEPTFQEKATTEPSQKRAIAAHARSLLRNDMTVYLDAGTTTGSLVAELQAFTGLSIITNDFSIVDHLYGASNIEVIHIGGRLEHSNRSSVGRLAAETLRKLNMDLAFISTSSWDLQRGVTTPSEAKVDVKLAAMGAASTAVLLASSSKFGTFGMYDVAPLNRFDRIITDSGLTDAAAQGIRDLGLALDVVDIETAESPAVLAG
jgi:DeoR/GlpR family transcriptional regulator of sugar metabolism